MQSCLGSEIFLGLFLVCLSQVFCATCSYACCLPPSEWDSYNILGVCKVGRILGEYPWREKKESFASNAEIVIKILMFWRE